jgi:hypothetical protein
MGFDMSPDQLTRAVIVAVVFVALYGGHMLGDYWIQTEQQANCKSLDPKKGEPKESVDRPDAVGNCLLHALSYTATQVAAVALAVWWLDLPVRIIWVGLAFAISGISHFVIDLRAPLRIAAGWFGKTNFWHTTDGGFNGAHLMDQAAHTAIIAFCAFVAAGPAL